MNYPNLHCVPDLPVTHKPVVCGNPKAAINDFCLFLYFEMCDNIYSTIITKCEVWSILLFPNAKIV